MLSAQSQKIINEYLSLPFTGTAGVRCPYFINRGRRGQLRVLAGKGTPQEIVEEAKIISLQYHRGLFDHNGCCAFHRAEEVNAQTKIDTIRQFLIDNNLGVDCSGFATHVLRAHFWETAQIDIAQKFIRNLPAGLIRKLIARLRPVESIGVRTGFANDANTRVLGDESSGYDYTKIQSGDVIIMLQTGPQNKRDHILVITACNGQTINYAHARAWGTEGQYGHGVNTGLITITSPGRGLLAQTWQETSPALPASTNNSQPNETLVEARDARRLEIRRIIN